MKRKVIVISFIIIVLAVILIATKPRFMREFKDSLINTHNTITVRTSEEYKTLKKADTSKKYFKGEKNIKIPILLYHQIPTEKSQRDNYFLMMDI